MKHQMKNYYTYISGNHTAIMYNFSNDIKMKRYFILIAFPCIKYDEIIVSVLKMKYQLSTHLKSINLEEMRCYLIEFCAILKSAIAF